jgi:hypothetical protein
VLTAFEFPLLDHVAGWKDQFALRHMTPARLGRPIAVYSILSLIGNTITVVFRREREGVSHGCADGVS